MEGHGSWRTTELTCEPNVQYRRGELLCVCNDNGTWPNPVCRDIFQILHSVELSGLSKVDGQTCERNKLYLVGCNVCFCSKNGRLEPELCTERKCTPDDPVVQANKETLVEDSKESVEIYAECKSTKLVARAAYVFEITG
jgi:hypothetical protein